jgi:hypothetical protein
MEHLAFALLNHTPVSHKSLNCSPIFNIKKRGIFLMFVTSLFNLRELILFRIISMPLADSESRWKGEAWVSCGLILEADVRRGRRRIAARRLSSTFENGGMRNHE